MRAELVDLLRCPCCHATAFDLCSEAHNESEIRTGQLHCMKCGTYFPVSDGIADLRTERAKIGWEVVQEQIRSGADDDLLLYSEGGYRDAPDSDAGHFSFGMMLNFDKAVSEMDLKGGESVLDLAAGTTWLTNHIAQRGARCVALDLVSQKYIGLESAEVFMQHNAVFYERVLGDMCDLPFRAESFDIVLSHAAIHHASDLKTALAQVHAVLKPGGRLFLVNEPTRSLGWVIDAPLSAEEVARGEAPSCFMGYALGLKRTGFHQTRVYYPPSLSRRLDALATGVQLGPSHGVGQTLKYRAVKILAPIWKRWRFVRYLTQHVLFWPYLLLIGQPTIIKARKQR